MKYRVKINPDVEDKDELISMGFKFDVVYYATRNDRIKYIIKGFEFEEKDLIFFRGNN